MQEGLCWFILVFKELIKLSVFLQSAHYHSLLAMDDKMFDHLRASTDAKYIKSLKELFMDFYGKAKDWDTS
jgi:hypothetical protein